MNGGFLLFGGWKGKPLTGGWNDYVGSFETKIKAQKAVKNRSRPLEWWHVVDIVRGEIVALSEE